jgi:hypothetical protein
MVRLKYFELYLAIMHWQYGRDHRLQRVLKNSERILLSYSVENRTRTIAPLERKIREENPS